MIVSNTTPLSSLLKIGRIHLLQALYGTVTIPPEVAAELDQAGPIHDGWREQLGFVRMAEPPMDDPVMKLLLAELDPGEAAAIALARRLNSNLLILDDMAGRRLAQRLGLTITGTVGVVLAAAEHRLIDEPCSMSRARMAAFGYPTHSSTASDRCGAHRTDTAIPQNG